LHGHSLSFEEGLLRVLLAKFNASLVVCNRFQENNRSGTGTGRQQFCNL